MYKRNKNKRKSQELKQQLLGINYSYIYISKHLVSFQYAAISTLVHTVQTKWINLRYIWHCFLTDDIFQSPLMGKQAEPSDHLLPDLKQSIQQDEPLNLITL